jgi:hypothetical protein
LLEDSRTSLEDSRTLLEDSRTSLEDSRTSLEDIGTAELAKSTSLEEIRTQLARMLCVGMWAVCPYRVPNACVR